MSVVLHTPVKSPTAERMISYDYKEVTKNEKK
jgi:hypothetical protein